MFKKRKHACLRRKIDMDLQVHDIFIADANNMIHGVRVLYFVSLLIQKKMKGN